MKEEYLHYLHRYKLLGNRFETTDGTILEILDFGQHNSNSGPDFLNGRIRLGAEIWAGSIEFHVRSSDWYRHGHQQDDRYNNVIAHFVFEHDGEVSSGGYRLPTVELAPLIDRSHYARYCELADNRQTIACGNRIAGLDPFVIFEQKERALTDRLIRKSRVIREDIERLKGNHLKAFHLSMARVFGGKVNNLAFEKLVDRLDLQGLQRSAGNEVTIPSVLFGASGLLPAVSEDPYVRNLIDEFGFQKHRLQLVPMQPGEWRYSRMYPNGFPDIRIAQFAALIAKGLTPSSLAEEDLTTERITGFLHVELPPFWNTHFRFANVTTVKSSGLSAGFIDLLIINSFVPFLFALGDLEDNESLKQRSLDLLAGLRPEKNAIIRYWNALGIKAETAFDAQALIEQKNEYCSAKKCLFCKIGTRLLRA